MPLENNGSIQLFNKPHDAVAVGYPNPTTETYTSKRGGLAGTTVQTATIVYTDATKASISTVERT